MIRNFVKFLSREDGKQRAISGFLINNGNGDIFVSRKGLSITEKSNLFVIDFEESVPNLSTKRIVYDPTKTNMTIDAARAVLVRGLSQVERSLFMSVNDSSNTTAQSISANTWATLVNDNAGINTDEGDVPADCIPFFDGSTSELVITNLALYSVVRMRVNVNLDPSSRSAAFDFRVLVTPPTGSAFSFIVANEQVVRLAGGVNKAVNIEFYIGSAIPDGSRIAIQVRPTVDSDVLTDGFFTVVERKELKI